MKELIKQFLRFTATGVTCFAIDFGLMVLLKECFCVHYLMASGISFCVATAVNYCISVKWVYLTKSKKMEPVALTILLILSAHGLGVNQIIMWFFVDKPGRNYML